MGATDYGEQFRGSTQATGSILGPLPCKENRLRSRGLFFSSLCWISSPGRSSSTRRPICSDTSPGHDGVSMKLEQSSTTPIPAAEFQQHKKNNNCKS